MLLLLLLEEVSLNTKLGLCILPEEGLQLCLWCGHLLGSPKVHEGPGCQRLARGWQLSWHKVRGPQVRGTCRWGATGSGQEGGRGLVAGVGNSLWGDAKEETKNQGPLQEQGEVFPNCE